MATIEFAAEWLIRSSILVVMGAFLLWLLRVTDSEVRSAAWKAVLAASLATPLLHAVLPSMPVAVLHFQSPTLTRSIPIEAIQQPAFVNPALDLPSGPTPPQPRPTASLAQAQRSFPWRTSALSVYLVIAGFLLCRIALGLTISIRILRRSSPAGETAAGIPICESERVGAPVTLGVVRPVVVLPAGWRAWNRQKRRAVFAHELSHIQRYDPAFQLASAIHRAILWISPLSWFLHQRIVQSAEEASDDAAIAATHDRTAYAELLLDFMQRGSLHHAGVAVPMAKYGNPDRRIGRILNGAQKSRMRPRWQMGTIVALAATLACVVATAQARPEFEAAAVSPSQRDPGSIGRLIQVDGGKLLNGRYEVRRASLLDLISAAYGFGYDQVIGGPSWLDWNRFDIIAQAPPGAPSSSLEPMLQSLLVDRFGLKVHRDSEPLSVFVLSRSSGEHKLKPANSSVQPACQVAYDNDGLTCRNTTMDAFAARLAAGRGTIRRVVNLTGIEGSWDFEISYAREGPRRGMFGIPPPGDKDRGIYDAIEKQLGLKLELRDVPQPVLVVDSAEIPGPNPPDIAARLRPASPEFEVATIKPCEGFDPLKDGVYTGVLLNTGCASLQMHISMAWDFSTQVQMGPMTIRAYNSQGRMEGPGWMSSKYFDISAKSPIPVSGAHDPNYLAMLRRLLIERFRMSSHYEDRPRDTKVLVAQNPKLKRADPAARTACDPGSVGTRGSRTVTVLTCRNVTMAQFAEQLSSTLAFGPVIDETGLGGSWDLSVSYMLAAGAPGATDAPGPVPAALEPVGGLTLREAIEQQLGIKIETRKRPAPVLVIDHMEENPAAN